MDIADKFTIVGVFLTYYRFVTVLKKLARSSMTPIV